MKNSFLLLIIFITFNSNSQDRITGELFSSRSEVIAKNGMVATSHPIASQVGLDILKKGGNAIDAAIAANAAIGLMEPTGNGIGGDLFAIVWIEKEKKLYGLNASGRSPQNLTLEYFKNNNFKSIPPYGPLPVSVPGCVDGWFELHDRFGKIKMNEILSPAIKYAEKGFYILPGEAYRQAYVESIIKEFKGTKKYFLNNKGKTYKKGNLFIQKDLSNTLKEISKNGHKGF